MPKKKQMLEIILLLLPYYEKTLDYIKNTLILLFFDLFSLASSLTYIIIFIIKFVKIIITLFYTSIS